MAKEKPESSEIIPTIKIFVAEDITLTYIKLHPTPYEEENETPRIYIWTDRIEPARLKKNGAIGWYVAAWEKQEYNPLHYSNIPRKFHVSDKKDVIEIPGVSDIKKVLDFNNK